MCDIYIRADGDWSLKKSLCMTGQANAALRERQRGESAVISKATDYNWPCHILSLSYFSFQSVRIWSGCVMILPLF